MIHSQSMLHITSEVALRRHSNTCSAHLTSKSHEFVVSIGWAGRICVTACHCHSFVVCSLGRQPQSIARPLHVFQLHAYLTYIQTWCALHGISYALRMAIVNWGQHSILYIVWIRAAYFGICSTLPSGIQLIWSTIGWAAQHPLYDFSLKVIGLRLIPMQHFALCRSLCV